MTWFSNDQNSESRIFAHKLGLQLLMTLLFLYFSYSGASELGLMNGPSRKFEGHVWLAKIMGATEIFGGLALLTPEGALGGAIFLTVAMACALVSSLVNQHPYAAAESLLMLNVSAAITYWRRPQRMKGD